MPLRMIRNDITKVEADAIVNPANEELLEGSGTSRGIYLAAGEAELEAACRKAGSCALGNAVITPAFALSAKYIIHAVGPVWLDGRHQEEEILYRTYWSAMKLAVEYRLQSVAFPLLSAGNYGFPKDKALRTAVRAISDFLMEEELLVWLVLYDKSAVQVSQKLVVSLEEYIDDHYVENKNQSFLRERTERTTNRLKEYFRTRRSREEYARRQADGVQNPFMPSENLQIREPQASYQTSPRSLEDLMNHMGETFSQMLLRLIDERGLKDSYVYKKANVDRRHFSKIRNDKNYTPNKKTVLAFALALELSMDETRDLMMRAGYAFSGSSRFDIIISYFIEKKQYDVFEINEVLFAYDQPLLG